MKNKILIMIDVETLGRREGDCVTEIGATAFWQDDHEDLAVMDFHQYLDMNSWSASAPALPIEVEVFNWRKEQGFDFDLGEVGFPVLDLCENLSVWLDSVRGIAKELECEIELWSWGGFDEKMLAGLFDFAKVEKPWGHWEWRDARTLCKVVGVERVGAVQHDALMDCVQQKEALVRALAIMDRSESVELNLGDRVASDFFADLVVESIEYHSQKGCSSPNPKFAGIVKLRRVS